MTGTNKDEISDQQVAEEESQLQQEQPLLQHLASKDGRTADVVDTDSGDPSNLPSTNLRKTTPTSNHHQCHPQLRSRRFILSSIILIGCLIPFILWYRAASSSSSDEVKETELQRIGLTPIPTHYVHQVEQSVTACRRQSQPISRTSTTDATITQEMRATALNSNARSTKVYASIETCPPFIDSDDSESNSSFNSSDPSLGHYPSPANLRDLWRFDGIIPDEQLAIRAEEPLLWIEPKLLHKTTSTMNTPGKVDPNTHRQPNMIVRVGERFTVQVETSLHWSLVRESLDVPILPKSIKGLYVWFYAHPHFMVAADMVDGPTEDELVQASLPASLSETGMITLNFTFSAVIPDVEWYECLVILRTHIRGTFQFWHLGGDSGYTVQVVDEAENEAARVTLDILNRLATESMDDPSAVSHILSTLTLPIPTRIVCDSDILSPSSPQSSLSRYLPTAECTSWNRIDPVGGRWVACHLLGPSRLQHCLRDGWLYVPSNCYYTVYDSTSMNTLPIWIVWAGSSIIRGNFLTQVDLMLQHRASTIGQSDFWKCWGWMDLQVDKYRISYLDWRWDNWLYNNVTGVAYADPLANIHKDYVADARSFLGLLTDPTRTGRLTQTDQEDQSPATRSALTPKVPDLMIFESPTIFNGARTPVEDLHWLIPIVNSMFHPDWHGRRILIPGKLQGHWIHSKWRRMLDIIDRYMASPDAIALGWETVSDFASLHLLHTHESFSRACHPHDRCNENGKHVCSIADEMTVTMLLNDLLKSNRTGSQQLRSRMSAALQTPVFKSHSPHPSIRHRTHTPSPRSDCSLIFPKGGSSPTAQTARASSNQLRFCTHCPRSLVPLSMRNAEVIHPECHSELYDTDNDTDPSPPYLLIALVIVTIIITFFVVLLRYKWGIRPVDWWRWCTSCKPTRIE